MNPRIPPEVVELDARGSTMAEGRFQVELSSAGLLEGLPITEVRPLDCRGNPLTSLSMDEAGPAMPGAVDHWKCTFAGVGAVDEVSDGVARGTFTYLTGPDIVADTLAVRVGSEEDGLDAHVVGPCCDGSGAPVRLSFGDVNTLDAAGSSHEDLSARVDAPGYEHAFVYSIARDSPPLRSWSYSRDGQLDLGPEQLSAHFRSRRTRPFEELWVGAIATRDVAPWSAGQPVRMVRRRVLP